MKRKDNMKIPFNKPYIGKEEIRAVKKTMKSGWLTSGPVTKEFEKQFAEYVGSKYAVYLSSCTIALQLSIQYHKIHDDIDTAYVPSLTFAATANEAYNAGLSLEWGDVDPDTWCLEPVDLQKGEMAIPVHLTGNKAPTTYSGPVVEDSAHKIDQDQCHGNKNMVCFSFYATKNMTTGEGGMIATNSKKQYEWLLKARHHGISRGPGASPMYSVDFVGWKANQSDILASIGIEQLKKLPDMDEKRRAIIHRYNKGFGPLNTGLHLYPLLVRNRVSFLKKMKAAGIQCSVHFRPLHQMKAYKSTKKLPVTEDIGSKVVSLPLYPEMTDKEVDYVIKTALATKQIL
jgi:dTDP-4-amino-4,6-dideoxygalactose transaminase